MAHPVVPLSAQMQVAAAARRTIVESRRRTILNPSDCAETPAQSARKKKRARRKNALEIERCQISWVTCPVARHNIFAGVADQSLKGKDEYENVIDLSEKRNEIRNEIER